MTQEYTIKDWYQLEHNPKLHVPYIPTTHEVVLQRVGDSWQGYVVVGDSSHYTDTSTDVIKVVSELEGLMNIFGVKCIVNLSDYEGAEPLWFHGSWQDGLGQAAREFAIEDLEIGELKLLNFLHDQAIDAFRVERTDIGYYLLGPGKKPEHAYTRYYINNHDYDSFYSLMVKGFFVTDESIDRKFVKLTAQGQALAAKAGDELGYVN